MAENYGLNSQFGLNISSNKIIPNTNSAIEENKLGKLFDTVTGYLKDYENVFTGVVEKEINMYERQAMFVGMNLRASDIKRNFDMNI